MSEHPRSPARVSDADRDARRRGRRAGLLTVLRHPRALWRFLSDREAPWWPRVLALLTLGYIVMPVDAIPDLVPFLGWLDDLGVMTFAMGFIASRAARYADDHPGTLPEPRT